MRPSESEWIDCIRCSGSGEYIECYDDLCHANGRCMHGNNTCKLCDGLGRITKELAKRWRNRDWGESVLRPDADLHARGLLHQVARRRHNREVTRPTERAERAAEEGSA